MDKLVTHITAAITVAIFTILLFYGIYSIFHFGFGKVAVPDWFTGYEEAGLPETFPFDTAIQYWRNKAQVVALRSGAVGFIMAFLLVTIKSKQKNFEVTKCH